MKKVLGVLAATILLGTALASAASAAEKQEGNWYAGLGVGLTTLDTSWCKDLALASCTEDDSDLGYKVLAGYQFNPNFALEASWLNLGESSFSAPAGSGEMDLDGIEFSAVGVAPLSEGWSAFAKAGLYFWDAGFSAVGVGGAGALSDSGSDLLYGIGAQYQMNEDWAGRLEWQVVNSDDMNPYLLAVSFIHSFKN